MSEITTQKIEFPCENCGANLSYKPGSDHIVCEYCGHKQKVSQNGEKNHSIREYDYLVASKQGKSTSVSELVNKSKEISCKSCGAVSIITTQWDRCSFCSSPMVIEIDSSEDIIKPESLLPFKISKEEAKQIFIKWISNLWFAPSNLRSRVQKKGMDGVYLPYWTYDSNTVSNYSGARGEYYYITETYQNEKGETATREVRKTRWYPKSGTVHLFFDDVLVCATKTLPYGMIDSLEPWDLERLKTYDPKYLSGFVTERYNVGLEEGFSIGKQKMEKMIRYRIFEDIGGDEQRIHHVDIQYDNIKFKHLLLPLWISSFRYGDRVYRFIVNARTGEPAGERPYSWMKIALAAITGILLSGLFYYLANRFL
ncbi:MAG: hypothetical protein KDK90_05845 [Leptospiraceae bacterium]|nr:hypothetical protein [Leptospiraceae bacterium]